MNSTKNLSAEAPVSAIQYSHALSANRARTEATLSLFRTKTFRVPFVPLKPNTRQQIAEPDRTDKMSVPTQTTEILNGEMTATKELSMESIDFMREELLRRSQTKTTVLEEALQRSEWSQRRFWGINE